MRVPEVAGCGSRLRKEGQAVMEGGTRGLKVLRRRRHTKGREGAGEVEGAVRRLCCSED